ncbi:MAG: MBL fold metallo-hydrolase [Solirubrobacterales bacterium]|nr:MBL fold metallo-hydrolase [Solirubrobacterales bacterium]
MQVKIWGARGSIPSPGPDTVRYGGNTSCVQTTLSDGTELVLDAGTGIRNLHLPGARQIHILLTHLHLDHVQGLLFFAALFDSRNEITIWGPPAPGFPLRDRIARYMSSPLTPVELRDVPSKLEFRDCPGEEWSIGSAVVRAEAVNHRGPTLGFRITEPGACFSYMPDHEPALIGPIDELEPAWISGYSLAHDADLLLHDCQYTDAEYPAHFGWGHSSVSDALAFAYRTGARHTLLSHHDPYHSDDEIDAIHETAQRRWTQRGGAPNTIEMATELCELDVATASPAALDVSARASAP